MMTVFSFSTATKIVFGPGSSRETTAIARRLGHKVLLVTGSSPERVEFLTDDMLSGGLEVENFRVKGEPSVEAIDAGLVKTRDNGFDIIIAVGGGSAIDAGKAIAALAPNEGETLDYLEVIGRGHTPSLAPLPFLALPTTAGTGAEVTKNAVLASKKHRIKVSLRSDAMLPQAAIVDPELTISNPPDVTASTGMDALTQLLEPFVTNLANPLTDALCRAGLERCSYSLRKAYSSGGDIEAREAMSLASLFGGLALANAKLGAVHGFAGPLGGRTEAPHGAVCAALVPHVSRANLEALIALGADHPSIARYHEAAKILTGSGSATAWDGIAWLTDLASDLNIPPLSSYGLTPHDIPEIVEQSAGSSSMKGNPIDLPRETLVSILQEAL